MEELLPHELSKLFPAMTDNQFHGLAKDIKKQSHLLNEIVLLDGQILDGVHRYKACIEVGVEPKFRNFNGSDGSPLDFVLSQNLERRHLTKSQRACVAAEVANMVQGAGGPGRQKDKSILLTSLDEAGKQLNVGRAYVQRAKRLKREAPEAFEEVKAGKKTVHQAMKPLMGTKRKPKKSVTRKSKSSVYSKTDLATSDALDWETTHKNIRVLDTRVLSWIVDALRNGVRTKTIAAAFDLALKLGLAVHADGGDVESAASAMSLGKVTFRKEAK